MFQYFYAYYLHGNKKFIGNALAYFDIAFFVASGLTFYLIFGNNPNDRTQADLYLSANGQIWIVRYIQSLVFIGALSYVSLWQDTKYLCIVNFKTTCPEKELKVSEKITNLASNLLNAVAENITGLDLHLFEKKDEIIYFNSVLLRVRGNMVEVASEFETYVKPMTKPTLSSTCIEETGVTQLQVDNGVSFKEAVDSHQEWLRNIAVPPSFPADKKKDWEKFVKNVSASGFSPYS
jgi:inhibitor of KinA sporulation pathway (predicted exonuclease)